MRTPNQHGNPEIKDPQLSQTEYAVLRGLLFTLDKFFEVHSDTASLLITLNSLYFIATREEQLVCSDDVVLQAASYVLLDIGPFLKDAAEARKNLASFSKKIRKVERKRRPPLPDQEN